MNVSKKQIYSCISLLFIVISTLFAFQNCAPPKTGSDMASSSASQLETTNPSPSTGSKGNIDGRCGTSLNTCTAGTFLNVADSSTQSLWKCMGSGSGLNILCSTNFSNQTVEGTCGTSLNSCMQGQFVDLADSSSESIWSCQGFNGGGTKTCRLSIDVNQPSTDGRCGSTQNTCQAGIFSDVADTSSQAIWACNGINGGSSITCAISLTGGSSATCGTAINTCGVGTFEDVADSATAFLWKCNNAGTYVPCSSVKPTCALTVQSRTHVGDYFTYNVNVTGATLPSSIKAKIYGTKKSFDGTSSVNDANGEVVYTTSPVSYSLQNTGGAMAGIYTRYFVITSADDVELCRTASVNMVLTPACTLSEYIAPVAPTDTPANSLTVSLAQSITFTANFTPIDQPLIGTNPTDVVWWGSFNTKADERGQTTYSASGFPFTQGNFTLANIGNFTRYYIARDSNKVELCKSNTVSFTVNNSSKESGDCGATVNTCKSGTFKDLNDSSTDYVWSCLGKFGGDDKTCTLPIAPPPTPTPTPTPTPPPPDNAGKCGVDNFTCGPGQSLNLDPTNQYPTDDGNAHWYCSGVNGGPKSPLCTGTPIVIPIIGPIILGPIGGQLTA